VNLVHDIHMERVTELFTPSRPHRGIATLWLLLAIAAGAVLYLFDPSANRLFPECPFRALTGFLCPGCGTTRALHQLIHGKIMAAIQLSPLLVIVAPILGYAAISTCLLVLRGRPLPQPRIHGTWIWALLAILIGFGVLRNTPWWS
jgi:hypothetical protein